MFSCNKQIMMSLGAISVCKVFLRIDLDALYKWPLLYLHIVAQA